VIVAFFSGAVLVVAVAWVFRDLALPPEIRRLVGFSKQRLSIAESQVRNEGGMNDDELPAAVDYLSRNPTYYSYHLLIVLREHHGKTYGTIPADTKAAVLASALANTVCMNDWGYLTPVNCYDGKSAQALVEIGQPAVKHLIPLLANKGEALCCGSEVATITSLHRLRRCDFAHRYVAMIMNTPYVFHEDIAQRDREIANLKSKLR
jgi:hypothetical protein